MAKTPESKGRASAPAQPATGTAAPRESGTPTPPQRPTTPLSQPAPGRRPPSPLIEQVRNDAKAEEPKEPQPLWTGPQSKGGD